MNHEDVLKLISMKKAFETLKERQKQAVKFIPDLEERVKRLRKVREESVGNYNLLQETIENLGANGFNVLFAPNDDKAIELILNELNGEKLVIKSKSNVTKEIKLVENLSKNGIEVVETDIGDRIIQILNETPSHPTGPASHLSSTLIAEKLSDHFGKHIEPKAEVIIETVRREIINYVKEANIGISGANAVTKEGAVVLLHNEGNIFEVINRPKKWIIVAGIDKIYPSIEDAINAAKIQSFYATGALIPSFIEIISGVSKTADIEKKLFKGVSNPKEVVLIMLDNKRKELIENGFKELFYCIGCGNCVVNCPAHSTYGSKFRGGRFALYSALYNGGDDLKLCLSCRKCKKNCPLVIDIPAMIKKVRDGNELYNFFASHLRWLISTVHIESLALYYTIFDLFNLK